MFHVEANYDILVIFWFGSSVLFGLIFFVFILFWEVHSRSRTRLGVYIFLGHW